MEANIPPASETKPALPSPATRPAAGQPFVPPPPTMGRNVYFTDRRLLQPKTYTAVVTEVLQPGTPDSHLHLLVMPPRQQSYPENGIPHVSKAKPGEPCWDWPPFVKGGA